MEKTKANRYKHAVVGGTFDRLHAGHKKLLDAILTHSEKVSIGIATENLINNKFLAEIIEPYTTREGAIKHYLQQKASIQNTSIVPLRNIFGNSLTDLTVEAIFVTEDTYPNAVLINQERKKLQLPALAIALIPFASGTDGKKITSERIRTGEIDRDGSVYSDLFTQLLHLPKQLRGTLQKPIGAVFADMQAVARRYGRKTIFITVGDIVTNTLQEAGHIPAISIIDHRTRRHPLDNSLVARLSPIKDKTGVQNHAGTITNAAVVAYKKSLEKYLHTRETQIVSIEGEEDLLALPAMLLAPLQSVVLYGQFEVGVVVNEVTERMKRKVIRLVTAFQ